MSSPPAPPLDHAPPPWLWQTAQQAILRGKLADGRARLKALLAQVPAHVPARMLLAGTVLAEGRTREATEELGRAIGFLPDDPALVVQLAQSLARLGETNAACLCLQHPSLQRSRNGAALTAASHIYHGIGLHREALQLLDRASHAGHDNPGFRYARGLQLQFNGMLSEAEQEFERSIQMEPALGRATLSLSRLRAQTSRANHIELVRRQKAQVVPGSDDEAALEFAFYKELEDLGEYDEAWQALERANRVMAQRLPYDAAAETRLVDGIIAKFDRNTVERDGTSPSGPTPIFIVGMPRSGTTLLERVLGSHSAVTSAGELNDFPRQLRWAADRNGQALMDATLLDDVNGIDFELLGRRYVEQTRWRAHGKPYFIDKLPTNFYLIGCIRRALPHARVIHITRDPMDVCFSNFRAMFYDACAYSYRLDSTAHQYRQYARLMAHWHTVAPGFVIDVPYAGLVQDTEATCRRLLDTCGLPFESGCLDHTRNASSVATLSSAQVRQPIHARGLGEWRRYEAQLEPLRVLIEGAS